MEKPKDLEDVLSEPRLCEWLDIPFNEKTGKSIRIGYWIKDGLEHISRSGQRFFTKQAVIDFLFKSETTDE